MSLSHYLSASRYSLIEFVFWFYFWEIYKKGEGDFKYHSWRLGSVWHAGRSDIGGDSMKKMNGD
jgi:hypothetical protein